MCKSAQKDNKGITNVKQGCKKWVYNYLPHDLLTPNFYPPNPNPYPKPYPNPHSNHNSQLYPLKLFLYSLEFRGVKSRGVKSRSLMSKSPNHTLTHTLTITPNFTP